MSEADQHDARGKSQGSGDGVDPATQERLWPAMHVESDFAFDFGGDDAFDFCGMGFAFGDGTFGFCIRLASNVLGLIVRLRANGLSFRLQGLLVCFGPVSFALTPFWRDSIIAGMWICTTVALIIHVIWISAPRWLYVLVYIIFGVSGVAFMGLFWMSPYAGPTVVILLCAGGACYIAGAIVYALRKPDPWPKVFGFHEIFHTGTVAGYACHMVAIDMGIVQVWP